MTSGTLQLEVVEARLTRDTQSIGKMDPYLMITMRQQKFQTQPHSSGGKTPTWEETFEINVKNVGDDITIKVCNKNLTSDDTVSIYFISSLIPVIIYACAQIGATSISASSLCLEAGVDDWFPIQFKGKQSGQVHLKSTWRPDATA